MDRNNDGVRDYIGVVLLDIDLTNRGLYKVHSSELHPHIPVDQGIWCRNRVHTWAYNTDFTLGSCGSYYPLQAGTRVLIQLKDGDYEHAEIVKIISDQEVFRLPLYCTPEARDLIFTIYRTPIFSNIFHVNEFNDLVPSLTGQPKNSIHHYFNCDIAQVPLIEPLKFGGQIDPDTAPETNIRTKYIINEDGIHIYTTDNMYVTVDKNGEIAVNGTVKINIKDNTDIHIRGDSTKVLLDGTLDVVVKKATKIKVDAAVDIHVTGVTNILCDSTINIQSGSDINLNSGTSAADAAKAEDSKGYNETPPADKELKGITRLGDVDLAAGKMVT